MKWKICVLVMMLVVGCLANVISVHGDDSPPIYVNKDQNLPDFYDIKYEYKNNQWEVKSSRVAIPEHADVSGKSQEDGLAEIQKFHTSSNPAPALISNVKDDITIGEKTFEAHFWGYNDKLTLDELTKLAIPKVESLPVVKPVVEVKPVAEVEPVIVDYAGDSNAELVKQDDGTYSIIGGTNIHNLQVNDQGKLVGSKNLLIRDSNDNPITVPSLPQEISVDASSNSEGSDASSNPTNVPNVQTQNSDKGSLPINEGDTVIDNGVYYIVSKVEQTDGKLDIRYQLSSTDKSGTEVFNAQVQNGNILNENGLIIAKIVTPPKVSLKSLTKDEDNKDEDNDDIVANALVQNSEQQKVTVYVLEGEEYTLAAKNALIGANPNLAKSFTSETKEVSQTKNAIQTQAAKTEQNVQYVIPNIPGTFYASSEAEAKKKLARFQELNIIQDVNSIKITKVPEYKLQNAKVGTPIQKITDESLPRDTVGQQFEDLIIDTKDGVIVKIENTKTKTTRELKEGIEITSIENGPMTLKFGDDVVTISDPEGSEITSANINPNTFKALNALNKEKNGNLGKVTLDTTHNYAQSGNTRVYAYIDNNNKPASTVLTLIDPEKGTWSEMEIHRQAYNVDIGKYEDEYIKYEGCKDCIGNIAEKIQGTSYTAEARGPNNDKTKWIETSVNYDTTRTNMQWDEKKGMYKIKSLSSKITIPGYERDMYDIKMTEDVYSKTGFFGLNFYVVDETGKLIDVSYVEPEDGGCFKREDNGVCVSNNIPSELADQMYKDMKIAMHGGQMNYYADVLKIWADYTAGYSGVSFLYEEPDPIIDLDQTMSQLLGGIDSWTSLICQSEMTQSLDTGSAFSSSIEGAYAHVQGERITSMNYSVSPPTTTYFYKVSFTVDPGSEYRGCNIKFKVVLKNGGSKFISAGSDLNKSMTSKDYEFSATKGEGAISYSGSNMLFFQEKVRFGQVCIVFDDILPEYLPGGEGCLVGVAKGDEICNSLSDYGQASIGAQEDICDSALSNFNPLCWGGG